MFSCKSKKHWWSRQEDAEKCCNGYVRCLAIGSQPPGATSIQALAGTLCGREWVLESTLQATQRQPLVRQAESLLEMAGATVNSRRLKNIRLLVDRDLEAARWALDELIAELEIDEG